MFKKQGTPLLLYSSDNINKRWSPSPINFKQKYSERFAQLDSKYICVKTFKI